MVSSTKHQDDLFSAGDWFYWKCEYENAKKHFQTIAVQPFLSDSDLIRCYKSLAATEVELKDYDEALNIYMKIFDLLEKIRDSTTKNDDLMSCCLSIGKVYWLKSEYNHAIIYHRRALKYAQSTQNISSIYKNLANIYTSAKNTYLAVAYFNDALKIDNECPSKSNLHLGQTYANMGTMYQAEENYQEALKYFEQAQKTLSETLPDTHIAIRKLNKTIRQLETNLKTTDNIQSDTISSIATQPVDHLDIFAANNIMILWLDDHIGQDDNCRALKMEFHQITNSFKMFDSPESFRQYLPYVKDRKLFCIIQGKYGKEVVSDIDRIVSPSMEPVVYIFCLNIKYLVEWALGQKCVMRSHIFDHEQNLLERLKRDVENYIKTQSINIEKKVSLESINESIDQIMQIVESCRNVTNVTTPSKETPIISN